MRSPLDVRVPLHWPAVAEFLSQMHTGTADLVGPKQRAVHALQTCLKGIDAPGIRPLALSLCRRFINKQVVVLKYNKTKITTKKCLRPIAHTHTHTHTHRRTHTHPTRTSTRYVTMAAAVVAPTRGALEARCRRRMCNHVTNAKVFAAPTGLS